MDRLRERSRRDEGGWILPAGLAVIAGIGIAALLGRFDSSEPPAVDRSRPVTVVEAIEGGDHLVSPNVVVDDPDMLLVRQGEIEVRVEVSEEDFQRAHQQLEEAKETGATVTTVLG